MNLPPKPKPPRDSNINSRAPRMLDPHAHFDTIMHTYVGSRHTCGVLMKNDSHNSSFVAVSVLTNTE